jgi:hypothetical protein
MPISLTCVGRGNINAPWQTHGLTDFRHDATPEIWQETYVSAVLRAILYSDDPAYYLDAYRRLDPITTPETELRFLQAAEALFPKGLLVTLWSK